MPMAFARRKDKDKGDPDANVRTLEPALVTGSSTDVGAASGGSESAPAPTMVAPTIVPSGASTKRLGEQLIGSQLITQEQLDAALAAQSASGERLYYLPASAIQGLVRRLPWTI